MMKKTWSTPVVEALDISATLGGSVKTFTESFDEATGLIINPTGGSVFPKKT